MAGSAELIGRARERRVRGDRLDRAAEGEGGLLLLAGEAGVGKTNLAEALGGAFAEMAARQPTAVFLDDLQWSEDATLGLLPSFAASVEDRPLLFLAVYRSDEVPRAHPLRRVRSELRRGRRIEELVLEPLGPGQSAELASRVIGRQLGPRLSRRLFERTEGVPLFVEELSAALAGGGRLEEQDDTVELPAGQDVPLPDTVREAVLLRTDRLSQAARHALKVASVAGARFDLGLVVDLAGAPGLQEAIERGFLIEVDEGFAAFRHALVREAVYAEIPWTRRRVHPAERDRPRRRPGIRRVRGAQATPDRPAGRPGHPLRAGRSRRRGLAGRPPPGCRSTVQRRLGRRPGHLRRHARPGAGPATPRRRQPGGYARRRATSP